MTGAHATPRVQDLGSGVWSVPVPIPDSPLLYTLVYAIESPSGPVLIDAGWQHPSAWEALSGGLASIGVSVGDVKGVVVTHHHPDHSGLAGRVREASGAWIAMHQADIDVVRLIREFMASGWDHPARRADALRRAGACDDEIAQVTSDFEAIDPPALPDRALADGELIDLPGRKLRVIWTPGHSPGHVCLHLEDEDRVFTGDHVLPSITPHIGLYPYDLPDVDPLGDFLVSLERIAELGPLTALPAHKWTFDGLADRAAEILVHHERRLGEVLEILRDAVEPLTLWDVAERMEWKRSWDELRGMPRGMAAGEAAAHLRTLEKRDRVRVIDGDPRRFAAA